RHRNEFDRCRGSRWIALTALRDVFQEQEKAGFTQLEGYLATPDCFLFNSQRLRIWRVERYIDDLIARDSKTRLILAEFDPFFGQTNRQWALPVGLEFHGRGEIQWFS